MSIIVETFIMCDVCHKNFGVDMRGRSGKEHRKEARSVGWVFTGRKDKCGVCKQAKNKPTGASAYVEKLEAIRAEVKRRKNEYISRDAHSETISSLSGRYCEAKEILSIIDNHLNK